MKTPRRALAFYLAALALGLFTQILSAQSLPAQSLSDRDAAAVKLNNPGFEEGDAGTLPGGWRKDEWNSGNTEFETRSGDDAAVGLAYVSIRSADEDDAKLIQTIKLKPKGLYRFSVLARASLARSDRKGAHISVMGIMEGSRDIHESAGRWEELVFYGRAGKSQKQAELCLRLGGYSSLNSGRVDFDSVSVQLVESLPPGSQAISLEAPRPKAEPLKLPGSDPLIIFLSLLGILALAYFLDRSPAAALLDSGKRLRAALLGLFFLGLALRLPFSFGGHGYQIDLNSFKGWAEQALSSRIAFFYRDSSFADYPPGYVYVLAVLGGIRNIFSLGFNSPAYEFIIRLPALAADFLLAWLLFGWVKKSSGASRGLLAAALVLLSPLSVLDSAVWGQVDSVFSLVLVISLMALRERRLVRAGIFYALAALVKPQAFIFAPVFLCVYISLRDWRLALRSVLAGLGVLVLGFLPFLFVQGPLFPFSLYATTLSSYPYASFNAANLWGAIGFNLRSLTGSGAFIGNWGMLAVVVAALSSCALFYSLARRTKKASTSQLQETPGLPVFETAAFLILSVFCFGTRMHERYLYPLIPLLLFAWGGRKSLGLALLAAGASLVAFLNVSQVYRLSLGKIYHIPPRDALFIALSILTLCLLPLFLILSRREEPFERSKRDTREKSALGLRLIDPAGYEDLGYNADTDKLVSMDKSASFFARYQKWFLSALILLCAILGVAFLGDLKAPQSAWKPANLGEAVLIDMGKERRIDSFSWYSGIGEGEFSFSSSIDGKVWSDALSFKPALYSWKNQAAPLNARYLIIRPLSLGAQLLELALWQDAGAAPVDAASRIINLAEGQRAESLLDVLENLPGEGEDSILSDEARYAKKNAGYMDSMYFDEIYHGRTAFEHLHAMEPYEWTHPPLGKLIIGVGIKLFGMSPFGWRIMGALFGILLIPLIYALARLAFPRGPYAFGAAALYALDFMRYTQTRIGTVDVYVVFFVLASYLFMCRYYLSALKPLALAGLAEQGKKEGKAPQLAKPDYCSLALSGLFFGLGAATKWNAVYSGAGLALVFFIAFIRRLAFDFKRAGPSRLGVFGRASALLGYCVLSFILLPLALYVAAYLPTLAVPGHDWASIWRYQGQMFNYHSKLVAEHSFSSPWWQWPLMIKPVWYFKAEGLKQGWTSTIVALGNPLIWWPSLLSSVAALFLALRRRDWRFLPIIAGFFAQYIPWVLVPRLTFLYHYFPAIPFALLSSIYVLRALMPLSAQGLGRLNLSPRGSETGKAHKKKKASAEAALGMSQAFAAELSYLEQNWLWASIAACLLLFIFFFPALSGLAAPTAWIRALRWLPSWFF